MNIKTTPENMHCTDQWQSLPGETVQVFLDEKLYRCGLVDEAMPDASGLWLAADGAHPREYIDKASGYQIWTRLFPTTGL
ncbi:hypothetical protein [Pseudarthrobacter raffinosi]|uniref:hypothetical protein n=1 Tax=Pseudarthrobacter raffinosi TaxID=2953651 RepID=UPI00208FCB07|nr:hypothetical protein [Pseudarthrobacter sp. MDT3-9]MCO4253268.1 hypothetical protein [Pseudarthrobacter sp. MDT3-9]